MFVDAVTGVVGHDRLFWLFKITLDFFPNPDFCGFLKTSTPILIRAYF
ncbi:hypothetical protein [Moraxella lacunata]